MQSYPKTTNKHPSNHCILSIHAKTIFIPYSNTHWSICSDSGLHFLLHRNHREDLEGVTHHSFWYLAWSRKQDAKKRWFESIQHNFALGVCDPPQLHVWKLERIDAHLISSKGMQKDWNMQKTMTNTPTYSIHVSKIYLLETGIYIYPWKSEAFVHCKLLRIPPNDTVRHNAPESAADAPSPLLPSLGEQKVKPGLISIRA